MRKRRICYLTGTRADFGLMRSTLHRLVEQPGCQLNILVTGMHLSPHYGMTLREIQAEGFDIRGCIPCRYDTDDGAEMACNISEMLSGVVAALMHSPPDLLLLLGDRGEMLAGAIAGLHLGVPVVHIHGGERSGTIDEPVRHAISKLSHWHLVATQVSRERLVRMGEREESIVVVGAPGIDGLSAMKLPERANLLPEMGFDPERKTALMVFHPVVQEAEVAAEQVGLLISVLIEAGYQVLALRPNADAGNKNVREVLAEAEGRLGIVVKTHLARPIFLAWLARADVLIGNSSSGIIEAASFGTPVVNVGTRQNLRERNRNVIDVPEISREGLLVALDRAREFPRVVGENIYGDGCAGERIVDFLVNVPLNPGYLSKCNAY